VPDTTPPDQGLQWLVVDHDTFVGREPELAELERRLAAACAGTGSAVLVEADPGLGKTALADELTRRANARGVAATWGACLEGEGAPAYRPWIQILAQLGRPTTDLTTPDLLDDGASRSRLFDEVARALRDAAAASGMLIVLDDLHWADVPSIRLLQVVVSELAGARLLVLGLYRGAEAYARAELAGLLPAILRERTAGRITLGGLTAAEVEQLTTRTLHRPADHRLLRAVQERAEGNPLFVLEVLRLAGTSGLGARAVPQGVREVIARRFDRVPAATRATIRQASVLGREFPVGLVANLAQRSPAEILELLDDAIASELIQPGGGHTMRFAHALMQEVAYAELAGVERQRLHQRAARAIQAAGDPDAIDALAHHLRQAAPLGGAAEALAATLAAARRGSGQLAYEHAAFQYREALALVALVPDPPVRRHELLLDLARCEFRSGAVTAAWAACREAADLGRVSDDAAVMADAATVMRGFSVSFSAPSDQIHQLCREALTMLRGSDPVRQARVLAQLTITANPWSGDADQAASQEALRIAEATGDADARFLALQARQTDLTHVGYVLERLAIGERAVRLGAETGRDEYLAWGHLWRMDAFAELGRRTQLDTELTAFTGVVGHMKEPLWIWRLKLIQAALAAMEGRHDEARALADEALVVGTRGGNETAEFLHLVFTAVLARQTGSGLPAAEAGVRRYTEHGPFLARGWLAVILASSGRLEEAARLWYRIIPHLDSAPQRAPEWLNATCGHVDLCVLLGDRETAPKLYDALLPFADRHAVARVDTPYEGPVALYLGKLARLLTDWDAAETHLERALRASAAMVSPPYEALAHLETARLMLARRRPGDARDADTHAETALDIARRLGLAPVEAEATTLLTEHRRGRTSPLSDREEQVAALVADGLSNRQIAARLHIAERTAENHVKNILDKLGFDTRARIAAWHARRADASAAVEQPTNRGRQGIPGPRPRPG
jgi:DNA-binding CsgD family transcriptional regulator